MTALAAGAGITKPILYRHFGDKQGLLAAWAERQARALGERITAELARQRNPRSRIQATITTYLATLEDDPLGYWFVSRRAVTADDPTGGPVVDVVETIVAAVAEVLEQELRRADAGEEAVAAASTWARALVGMVQQVGDHWLTHRRQPGDDPPTRPEDTDRERLAGQLTDLVWLGFRGMADQRVA